MKIAVTYHDMTPEMARLAERDPILPDLSDLLAGKVFVITRAFRIPPALRDEYIEGLTKLVCRMQSNYRIHKDGTCPDGFAIQNVPTDAQFRSITDDLMATIQSALGGTWLGPVCKRCVKPTSKAWPKVPSGEPYRHLCDDCEKDAEAKGPGGLT